MSAAKISSREGALIRSVVEECSTYPNIDNAPKLRHQASEDGENMIPNQPWMNELYDKNDKGAAATTTTRSSFGTVRTFSPTMNSKSTKNKGGNRIFSLFFDNKPLTTIETDLSTKHIEDKEERGLFNNYIWNKISAGKRQHFIISDNFKFILNCCMWYISSSLTNNIGKSIMNVFQFPVTLTFIQFGLVAFWCFLFSILFNSSKIRSPTGDIINTITPLALFLIVGHVFSSIAISRIPVSMVHTIKALAPLFTVLFYRFIFGIGYTTRVYFSLLPLTLGVILACSFTFSNNFIGLSCALSSCFIFVTQNIFSKKLLFKESRLGDKNPNKLDKLNVLFYSSTISFLLMIPLWICYDGNSLFLQQKEELLVEDEQDSISTIKLISYFILNGTMNFSQNWFAFTTLSLTSPVTYSILSLLKRIFVIVMSIVWFGQQITFTQSIGILLTFIGLYMYQKAKSDVDKGENKIRENNSIDLLPIQQKKSFYTTNTIKSL